MTDTEDDSSIQNLIAKSTVVLTEHLGYAPIAVIDDIINSANQVLYRCTDAMENFLRAKYPKGTTRLPKEAVDVTNNNKGDEDRKPNLRDTEEVDISEEIELGTAKLETLFESVVDLCFDKYELYVLRNLLVVPKDLINDGWFRLEHQKDLDFSVLGEVEQVRKEAKDELRAKRQEMKAQKKEDDNSTGSTAQDASKNDDDDGEDDEDVDIYTVMNQKILDTYQKIAFQNHLSSVLDVQMKRAENILNNVIIPFDEKIKRIFELDPNTPLKANDPRDVKTLQIIEAYKQIVPMADQIRFLGFQLIKIINMYDPTQSDDNATSPSSSTNTSLVSSELYPSRVAAPINNPDLVAKLSTEKDVEKQESELFVDIFTQRAIQKLLEDEKKKSKTSDSTTEKSDVLLNENDVMEGHGLKLKDVEMISDKLG